MPGDTIEMRVKFSRSDYEELKAVARQFHRSPRAQVMFIVEDWLRQDAGWKELERSQNGGRS